MKDHDLYQVHDHPDFDGHETVSFVCDPETGLRSIIAIHRHRGSFAAGGVRMQPYGSVGEALSDVFRLSRAMTYKIAAAGLPVGGAKSVIFGDPATDKNPELLAAFGRAVNRMGGSYYCGADVGIHAEDLVTIRRYTAYTPAAELGDLAIPTATGVLHALRAGVERGLGRDSLDGVHLAVQGLGQVGAVLCELLAERGAELTVADVVPERSRAVAAATGAAVVSPEEILFVEADVLSPCALGGVLDLETAARIRARVICGAANNQLASAEVEAQLAERDIVYVPDFVANAGGVIGGLQTHCGFDDLEKTQRLEAIHDTVLRVLDDATVEGILTVEAAERVAREVLRSDSLDGQHRRHS